MLHFDIHSDELKRHYNLRQYWIQVSLEDLASFDEELAGKLQKQPTEFLPLVWCFISVNIMVEILVNPAWHNLPLYVNIHPFMLDLQT